MKSRTSYAILILAFALMLAACGGGTDTESAIATGIAQTQQISALETAAAGGAPAPDQGDAPADPADAEQAAPTETPTITNTPTPDIPQISVSQDTNCRTGPAVYYGYKDTINVGEVLEVVGVHAQGNDYVIVDYAGGATCWLWLQYADKKDFNSYGLTAYNTPPTPTPTYTPTPAFDWSGTWQIWVVPCSPCSASFVVAGNNVTGTFSTLGVNVTLTGVITNGGQNLSGTWSSDVPTNGDFQFQIKSGNLSQFVGSMDGGSDPWCGAKNGASMPSPCQWP